MWIVLGTCLECASVLLVQVLIRCRCEKRLRLLQSSATTGAPPGAIPGAIEGRSHTDVLPVASHSNIVPFSFPHDIGPGTETMVSLHTIMTYA